MDIKDERFDNGKAFDWGKTSEDYAKYRDIYPKEFYNALRENNVGIKGQRILDLGTGTGVIPRNMYYDNIEFIATDISENQIEAAKKLVQNSNMNIRFKVASAEDIDFPDNYFDAAIASQCFFYFNHEIAMPKLRNAIKKDGTFIASYMAWLPYEDEIAMKSEDLILKYNPVWNGARETRHPLFIPEVVKKYFNVEKEIQFDIGIPFTREAWHGRMKACRGVGASMTKEDVASWEEEHKKMLLLNAPGQFNVKHYVTMTVMKPLK